jgi:hypothetical protein
MNFEADAGTACDQSPARLLRRSLPSPLRHSVSAPLHLLHHAAAGLAPAAAGGSPAASTATGATRPGTPGAEPELYRSDRACLVAEVEAQMRKGARLRAELQQAQVGQRCPRRPMHPRQRGAG